MVTASYFASTAEELGSAAANLPPVVTAVRVNASYGPCPHTVQYEIQAHDPNPGGYISKIAWNLETYPGTRWSQSDSPVHTFTRPYLLHSTFVYITNDHKGAILTISETPDRLILKILADFEQCRYQSNVAGVTVTSSLGKDTWVAAPAVDTVPSIYPFRSSAAVVDAHTVAIMRPNELSDGM